MQLVVPAFHAVGTGVSDVFSAVAPLHLVALVFHVLNKALPVRAVQQCVLNGFNQGKLPALTALGGAVFSRQCAFFLLPFVITLQHGLAVRHADFIVDPAVLYQIIVILVQFFPVLKLTELTRR
jgi:hypothetical protein